MSNHKLTPDARRDVILTAACRIATERGIWAVAHGTVAKRCVIPTSTSTVKHYYPTKHDMWRAVLVKHPEMRDAAMGLGYAG